MTSCAEGTCQRLAREKTLMIAGPSSGAWRRVARRIDLKFSGLVDLRPVKIKVWSVFKNYGQICTVLSGLTVGHRGSMAVRGGASQLRC